MSVSVLCIDSLNLSRKNIYFNRFCDDGGGTGNGEVGIGDNNIRFLPTLTSACRSALMMTLKTRMTNNEQFRKRRETLCYKTFFFFLFLFPPFFKVFFSSRKSNPMKIFLTSIEWTNCKNILKLWMFLKGIKLLFRLLIFVFGLFCCCCYFFSFNHHHFRMKILLLKFFRLSPFFT